MGQHIDVSMLDTAISLLSQSAAAWLNAGIVQERRGNLSINFEPASGTFQTAKELLFQSRFINAKQAKDYGLVNRVIPRERLLDETLEYATDVAANDPFDMRMTKLAVNQALDAQGLTSHIYSAHSRPHGNT